jgi:hypothetical protein
VIFGYQWLRDGVPVSGATLPTYVLLASDSSHMVSVQVTGSLPGYGSVTQTSPKLAVPLQVMKVGVTKITGTFKAGQTITATASSWATGATISYQWLLDGKFIKGATGKSLKITSAQKGHKVSLVVTESLASYSTATSVTAAIKVG